MLYPNPKGKRFKTPVEDRVDVYLAGANKPYLPTYGSVSKRDQATIDAHMAEVAAAYDPRP